MKNYISALLAQLTYNNVEKNESGWQFNFEGFSDSEQSLISEYFTIIDQSHNLTGFDATTFKFKKDLIVNNEVIYKEGDLYVAYRGTEGNVWPWPAMQDLTTDALLAVDSAINFSISSLDNVEMYTTLTTTIINAIEEYYDFPKFSIFDSLLTQKQAAIEYIKYVNDEYNQGGIANIYSTGHSLGGNLANTATIGTDLIKETITFNGAGLDLFEAFRIALFNKFKESINFGNYTLEEKSIFLDNLNNFMGFFSENINKITSIYSYTGPELTTLNSILVHLEKRVPIYTDDMGAFSNHSISYVKESSLVYDVLTKFKIEDTGSSYLDKVLKINSIFDIYKYEHLNFKKVEDASENSEILQFTFKETLKNIAKYIGFNNENDYIGLLKYVCENDFSNNELCIKTNYTANSDSFSEMSPTEMYAFLNFIPFYIKSNSNSINNNPAYNKENYSKNFLNERSNFFNLVLSLTQKTEFGIDNGIISTTPIKRVATYNEKDIALYKIFEIENNGNKKVYIDQKTKIMVLQNILEEELIKIYEKESLPNVEVLYFLGNLNEFQIRDVSIFQDNAKIFDSFDNNSINIYGKNVDIDLTSGTDNVVIHLEKGASLGNINIKDGGVNDIITFNGSNNAETIIGTKYNDKIIGNSGNDIINGGAGNDTIYGSDDKKNITLEAQNDILSGGEGNDYIYFDYGSNLINGDEGNDWIEFYENPENIIQGDFTNIITGGYGRDIIKGSNSSDIINDVDLSDGSYLNFNLNEVNENSTIENMYGDWIEGNGGNDIIYGTQFGDQYIYRAGDGNDTIIERKAGEGNGIYIDRLSLYGIEYNNVVFSHNNTKDLTISFSGNTIILKDFMNLMYIEEFKFLNENNEFGINFENILSKVLERFAIKNSENIGVLEGNNVMHISHTEILRGISEISNEIKGGFGKDIIYGGNKNDIIGEADINSASYLGNSGGYSNINYGDVITGGKGDDTIYGTRYSDTFNYKLGDGIDTIFNYGNTFKDILNIQDIYIGNTIFKCFNQSRNDLTLEFNSSDKIILKDFMVNYNFETFIFNDIEYILSDILENIVIIDNDYGNEILGTNYSDKIYGNGGNDTITSGNGKDIIESGDGNDIIYGNLNNLGDTINAGSGFNTIYGNGFGDLYLVNVYELATTTKIYETNEDSSADFKDILKLNNVSSSSNLRFTRNGHDLNIQINVDNYSNQNVIIDNYFNNVNSLEEIHFYNIFGELTILNNENILSNIENNTDYLNQTGTLKTGTNGNDIIYGTSGNDTINAGAGNDYVYAGSGNDVVNGDSGDDTLYGESGNDVINGGIGIDIIYGGKGNDDLKGGSNNSTEVDTIYGNDGDDIINSGQTYTGDIIYGGKGNDIIYSSSGSDVYHYYLGDGNDTIIENNSSGSFIDILYLHNIDSKNVDIYRMGNIFDVIIEIKDNGEKIIFKNLYSDNNTLNYLDKIIFDDGSFWDINKVKNLASRYYGTQESEIIKGNQLIDEIYGKNGNDTISGREGNDIIYGEDGDDIINGNGFSHILDSDTIYGGSGNDLINQKLNGYSYNIGDIVEGGKGNDIIYIGQGNDTLIYNLGDGNDIIRSYDSESNSYIDKIIFGDGIDKDNIKIYRDGGNNSNIYIELSNGEKINLDSYLSSLTSHNQIDFLEFSNGSKISKDEIIEKVVNFNGKDIDETIYSTYFFDKIHGNGGNDTIIFNSNHTNINDEAYGDEGNDTINGNGYSNTIYGGNGDDILNGNIISNISDQDIIYGGDGNDRINSSVNGYMTGDIVEGGKGNDTIYIGLGNDTLIYNLGDGNDTISSYDNNTTSFIDKIVFGDGITKDNIKIYRDGGNNSNIYIEFSNGEKITLNSYLNSLNSHNQIDFLEFSNGSKMSKDEIIEKVVNFNGKDIDETIYSTHFFDKIHGNGGNDTIIFNSNHTNINDEAYGDEGNDTIKGNNYANTIYGGDGADILYGNGLSNTIFDNDKIYGGDGNDTINAPLNGFTATGDIVEGGKGNDTIYIGKGNDTLIYNLDDGNDIIDSYDNDSNSYIDKIVFGDEITKDNIKIYRDGGNNSNVYIEFSNGEKITLNSYLSSLNSHNQIDFLEFSDGSSMSKDEIINILKIYNGSENNDIIFDTVWDDTIYGNGGDDNITINRSSSTIDKIFGGDGNDIITGNSLIQIIEGNEGNDTIKGGLGSDTIKGGNGNDILNGNGLNDSLDQDYIFGEDGDDTINSAFNGYTYTGDVVEGGKGNDIIYIGQGNDTLIYNLGDGNDTISSFDNTSKSYIDKIIFGEGITKDNIKIYRDGGNNSNVYIEFSNGEKITLNSYLGSLTSHNQIDFLEFSDGSSMSKDEIINILKIYNGSENNDIIFDTVWDDTIYGNGGDDNITINRSSSTIDKIFGGDGNDIITGNSLIQIIEGNEGNDTIKGGLGSDTIKGGNGNDILNGNGLNDSLDQDYIFGEDGDDTINSAFNGYTYTGDVVEGGKGNDIIYIGQGNDTLIYNLGDGNDTISSFDNTSKSYIDKIIFGEGITKDNIKIYRDGGNNSNVYIEFSNGEKITLNSYLGSLTSHNQIDFLEFSDGSSMSKDEIINILKIYNGSENNDIIFDTVWDDTIYGSENNDTIIMNKSNASLDNIYGGGGNDTFIVNNNTTTIKNIIDTDILILHNKTIKYNANVLIENEFEEIFIRDMRVIEYFDGTNKYNINSFKIGTSNGNGIYIPVQYFENANLIFNNYSTNKIEDFYSKINGDEFDNRLYTLGNIPANFYGYAGDDYLMGSKGNDYINGGSGNDYLSSGYGNDFLVGESGDDYYYLNSNINYPDSTVIVEDFSGFDIINIYNTSPYNLNLKFEGNNLIINEKNLEVKIINNSIEKIQVESRSSNSIISNYYSLTGLEINMAVELMAQYSNTTDSTEKNKIQNQINNLWKYE
jgi:Ca2+-binding RTX toxin-like protein